jgi:hypothetical protein
MKTVKTTRELKQLTETNRNQITSINGVPFGAIYPLLTVSNRFAYYYDVPLQCNVFLYAPYTVQMKAAQ